MEISQRLMQSGMSEAESQQKAHLFQRVERHLAASRAAEVLRWFVPGRIEVLGKHTDYAGGRSLLCTAERGFCVAAVARTDTTVRIHDVIRQTSSEFELSPNLVVPGSGWRLYAHVVARRISRNFPGELRGADICFASDLPSAAGMSSSSALVVALFSSLAAVNDLPSRDEYRASIQSATDLAGYLGCIENGQTYRALVGDSGVGTFGGSEDHTAMLTSEAGHLKQFSFCPVRHEQTVRLPDGCVFVIGVSGVVADKTGSAKARYNQASSRARQVLDRWQAHCGSTASTLAEAVSESPDAAERIRAMLRELDDAESRSLLDRFEQFVLESNVIIPHASSALACGDLAEFGKLVDESQLATEKLLGNQVPETVWLAQSARKIGAYAASAFGAGFGGSVWALVSSEDVRDFTQRWEESYLQFGHASANRPQFFVTRAAPAMLRLSDEIHRARAGGPSGSGTATSASSQT